MLLVYPETKDFTFEEMQKKAVVTSQTAENARSHAALEIPDSMLNTFFARKWALLCGYVWAGFATPGWK